MLRIILLIMSGGFLVQDIITMITDDKVEMRGSRLMVAFIFGLVFYYIWIT